MTDSMLPSDWFSAENSRAIGNACCTSVQTAWEVTWFDAVLIAPPPAPTVV
jgi:hypothetical protein